MDVCICEVRGLHTPSQHELVRRQILGWRTNDLSAAVVDWDSAGFLTAPRGVKVPAAEIPGVVDGWTQDLMDLEVEVTSLFSSPDEAFLCVEWTWSVSRRSDGARSVTEDAIVVELKDGFITSWREYFDTWNSVEFPP